MSAQPAEPVPDPLDPENILAELPEDEREFFVSQYRLEVEQARDPAGYKQLRRFLRLWNYRAGALKRPGFREAEQAAMAGTSRGMPLDDAIRMRDEGTLDGYISEHFGAA